MSLLAAACGTSDSDGAVSGSTPATEAAPTTLPPDSPTTLPPEEPPSIPAESGIVSLDSVTPSSPTALVTAQELVTLGVTVDCAAPDGSVCQIGLDFIAAYGSRIEGAEGIGFGESVDPGTHTVEIGGATRAAFTGDTVGVYVALYLDGTDEELAGREFRSSDLEYTWLEGRPDAEQQALVDSLVTSFNTRDLDGFLDAFGASPPLMETAMTWGPPSSGNVDRIVEELNYRWTIDEGWELQECALEGGNIECELSVTDMLRDIGAMQRPTKLTLRQDDAGAIEKVTLDEDTFALIETATAFYEWVEENHPDQFFDLFIEFQSGLRVPRLTNESIALRLELIPEYLATLGE